MSLFQPVTRYISQMIQDSTIVTMENEQELECDLSNGATCNDLERTITLNISQTATEMAIVTTEGEQETTPKLSNGTNFNDPVTFKPAFKDIIQRQIT